VPCGLALATSQPWAQHDTGPGYSLCPLVLTTGERAPELPPAGAPRLELYTQNRHPEFSGGPRTLRTLDLVDLSAFGRTRKTQLGDFVGRRDDTAGPEP
jgi:hypothetical protein